MIKPLGVTKVVVHPHLQLRGRSSKAVTWPITVGSLGKILRWRRGRPQETCHLQSQNSGQRDQISCSLGLTYLVSPFEIFVPPPGRLPYTPSGLVLFGCPRGSTSRIVEGGAIYIISVAAGRATTHVVAFWNTCASLLSCFVNCSTYTSCMDGVSGGLW